MISLAISLAFAGAAQQAASPFDAIANARSFLEAFSTSPASTKKSVTDDALIVIGDIGGPYSEFLRDVAPAVSAGFRSCRAGVLAMKPVDPSISLDQMLGTGRDRPRKRGEISVVEGQFLCPRPDGSNVDSKVTVVFEDGRVAMLGLWGRK